MSVQQITLHLSRDQAEPAESLLFDRGALSVALEDPGGEPILEPTLGENPLWETVRVKALFEAGVDLAPVREAMQRLLGGEPEGFQAETLADQPWERAWMEYFEPMAFGDRLWIVPTGFAPPEPDAVNLQLDPGLAFGTGTHPTTALCLRYLDRQAAAGEQVVDYGCGSGVLGIAALLLGAGEVSGVDNDPQALRASNDNAARNGVASRLRTMLPEAYQPSGQADGVVANILAGVLVTLAPTLVASLRPGGWIALSGILAHQADSVREAFAGEIDFQPLQQQEDWVLLCGHRRI